MPVPVGTPTELAAYLNDLETRLAKFERAQTPSPLYPMSSSTMSTTNALTYINCAVYCTDLNVIAHSNGSHWFREDTGAQIV